MTARILELSQHAGDDHLGQTLVRLARLAATRHQFETASGEKTTLDKRRAHGPGPQAACAKAGTDAGHTSTPPTHPTREATR
jgi:hypothetical protein